MPYSKIQGKILRSKLLEKGPRLRNNFLKWETRFPRRYFNQNYQPDRALICLKILSRLKHDLRYHTDKNCKRLLHSRSYPPLCSIHQLAKWLKKYHWTHKFQWSILNHLSIIISRTDSQSADLANQIHLPVMYWNEKSIATWSKNSNRKRRNLSKEPRVLRR